MSRVPVYFDPHYTDSSTAQFAVLSEEWSERGQPHAKLATVTYDAEEGTCTVVPEKEWIENGQFPSSTWKGDIEAVSQILTTDAKLSIYSRRLFKNVLWLLQFRARRLGAADPA